MNRILILTAFLFVHLSMISQNCYQVIADFSGVDISSYQAELNTTACELQQSIPSKFKNQFKVYSFGFYSNNEFMQGGFEAIWNQVISEIPSEYYLIFGKQSDSKGVYSKFWVDIKP